jgi:hypothetical protein
MPTKEEALRQMQDELEAIAKKNRAAFEGAYGEQIKKLMGLSQQELDAITPGVSNATVYAQLIDVVKAASEKNLSIADLKQRIEALGTVAVEIAKKAGVLAGFLV